MGSTESTVPYGYCHCGCGQKTSIASESRRDKGHTKGEPVPFCYGHRRGKPFDERYVVDSQTGCWVWQVGFSRKYGKIKRHAKTQLAHRVSYEMHVGPIPEGLVLDHLCKNRACVNPAHLEPVTVTENNHRSPPWSLKRRAA